MSNVSRVKETNKAIDEMFEKIPDSSFNYEDLITANLTAISLSLKDISLTLARLCDEMEAHNADK